MRGDERRDQLAPQAVPNRAHDERCPRNGEGIPQEAICSPRRQRWIRGKGTISAGACRDHVDPPASSGDVGARAEPSTRASQRPPATRPVRGCSVPLAASGADSRTARRPGSEEVHAFHNRRRRALDGCERARRGMAPRRRRVERPRADLKSDEEPRQRRDRSRRRISDARRPKARRAAARARRRSPRPIQRYLQRRERRQEQHEHRRNEQRPGRCWRGISASVCEERRSPFAALHFLQNDCSAANNFRAAPSSYSSRADTACPTTFAQPSNMASR